MSWIVRDYTALNLDDVDKATVAQAGSQWEVRVHSKTTGLYVVDSTHQQQSGANYRISQLGNLGQKAPNSQGVAINSNSVFVFWEGCSAIGVGQSGTAFVAFAVPTGEGNPANYYVLKTGTEQECKDYLTGLLGGWY